GIDVIRFRYAPTSLETLAYTGTMAEQVRDSWAARLSLGSMLGVSFWRVLREQQRIAPRLLHAHWWFPAGVVAAATSRVSRVPFVTTMHGSDVRLARSTAGAANGLGWVMRASRVTTTVSRWLADEAHAMTPALPPPLVAPLPAATELFTPGGSRAGDRLLFVGRLNVQKGIELLLRAVAAMKACMQLDVVGDGPDAASMRALASSLGIADRITWHGALPQSALPDFYRRATALVVPSRDEGLGLVAVEAQLCETPVVAFDSGGLRDIIDHDVTGILVGVFSPEALARATDDLLASPGRASSLGTAARRKALALFSPDAVARNYEAIYRTALGAKSQ
ncbi:MAG TPA: glycosyltransferase, partial [Gemmatimonadaceae bacterium]|nr:glycosyltransferase [Gemmatimonadaceae bacterium]